MRSVFISSTFRDMQAERDALSQVVLPDVSAEAARHHEDIDFIDLRWGVDTSTLESEEGARKVLSVCLDEIEHAQPYMIILLGERYGWIPDRALMENVAGEKDYSIDDDFKSVTALEIEFGSLQEDSLTERCLFYMREGLENVEMSAEDAGVYRAESSRHREKLNLLKQKIEKRIGRPIPTYHVEWDEKNHTVTGLDSFCEMVSADLKALLETEWKESEKLSEEERGILNSRQFFEKKAQECTALDELIEDYKREIKKDSTSFFLLKGVSGSGKSTILGKLACDLEEEGADVFPFVCGSAENTSSTEDLLKQLVMYFKKLLKKSPEKTINYDYHEYCYHVAKYIKSCGSNYGGYSKDRRLYIMIDAMEFLSGDGSDDFGWAPDVLPDNVTIVSCFTDDKIIVSPRRAKDRTVVRERTKTTKTDAEEILRAVFKRAHKEINDDIVQRILRFDSATSPLFLSLLAHRLIIMDSADFGEISRLGGDSNAINRYLLQKVEETPDDIGGLCRLVMKEAGARIDKDMADRLLKLIYLTPMGLRERDITTILQMRDWNADSLTFARLIKFMRPFFLFGVDGRIDFSHQIIRRSVKDLFFFFTERINHTRYILDYLKTLPALDPVCADYLTYCATNIEEWQDAVTFVSQLDPEKEERALNASLRRLVGLFMTDDVSTREVSERFLKNLRRYRGYESFVKILASHIDSFFASDRRGIETQQRVYSVLLQYLDEIYQKNEVYYNLEDYAKAMLTQAELYGDTGKYREAYSLAEKCLSLLEKSFYHGQNKNDLMARAHVGMANFGFFSTVETTGVEEHTQAALKLTDDPEIKIRAYLSQYMFYKLYDQVYNQIVIGESTNALDAACDMLRVAEFFDRFRSTVKSRNYLGYAYRFVGESHLISARKKRKPDSSPIEARKALDHAIRYDEQSAVVYKSKIAYYDLACSYSMMGESLIFMAALCDKKTQEKDYLNKAKHYLDLAKPLVNMYQKGTGNLSIEGRELIYLNALYVWYAVTGDKASQKQVYKEAKELQEEGYRTTGDKRFKRTIAFLKIMLNSHIPKYWVKKK